MFDLDGRTTVVTGGGSGIGRAIALAMASAGAEVFVAGRRSELLDETVQQVEDAGGSAVAVPTDITDRAQVDALVASVIDRHGRIDSWVNNAGSASRRDTGALIDLTEDQFDHVVDLNLKWSFFAAQSAARAMTDGGSIINISSRSGSTANPMTGQYGAAKAGIENLTRTMSVEWGHLGIRVNAIAPGLVLTDNNRDAYLSESRQRRQLSTVPLQRLGVPDDVGPLCVYFASDESRWVSGTVVPVNGGSTVPVGLLTYLHHKNADISVPTQE